MLIYINKSIILVFRDRSLFIEGRGGHNNLISKKGESSFIIILPRGGRGGGGGSEVNTLTFCCFETGIYISCNITSLH